LGVDEAVGLGVIDSVGDGVGDSVGVLVGLAEAWSVAGVGDGLIRALPLARLAAIATPITTKTAITVKGIQRLFLEFMFKLSEIGFKKR